MLEIYPNCLLCMWFLLLWLVAWSFPRLTTIESTILRWWCFFLLFVLSRTFLFYPWCWWSRWRTQLELCRNVRHHRSLLGRTQMIFAPIPDQSILQMEVRLVLRVWILVQWRDEWEIHWLPLWVWPKPPGTSPPDLIESSCVERTQCGTEKVRLLSQPFLWENVEITGLSLSDLAVLWCKQVPHNIVLHELSRKHLSCHLQSFLPANFASFFLFLPGEHGKGLIRCQSFHKVRALMFWYISGILSTIMIHHHHVLLYALSRMLSSWKKMCPHYVWNFSWARNSRPNSFFKRLRFLLKVFLGFQCDFSCCRLPWTRWCLICWIFLHNDGVEWRNLSTAFELWWCTRSPKPTFHGSPC